MGMAWKCNKRAFFTRFSGIMMEEAENEGNGEKLALQNIYNPIRLVHFLTSISLETMPCKNVKFSFIALTKKKL